MEINKRNRSELKSYFVTNAIPTEGNFGDLIDGMLNQKEDGILKQPGSPLSVEAAGDENSQKKLLNFYKSFDDANPEWVLGLRPRANPLDSATQKQGLGIMDNTGVTRLFLDRTTGNVGVGTLEPSAKLHVGGNLRVDGAMNAGALLTAEKGLVVPAGQPVNGVSAIDFRTQHIESSSNATGWFIGSATVAFDQPVKKAFAAVMNFNLGMAGGANKAIEQVRIEPQVAISTTNNKEVIVSVTCGMTGGEMNSQTINAPSYKKITVLVIAVLENAY